MRIGSTREGIPHYCERSTDDEEKLKRKIQTRYQGQDYKKITMLNKTNILKIAAVGNTND